MDARVVVRRGDETHDDDNGESGQQKCAGGEPKPATNALRLWSAKRRDFTGLRDAVHRNDSRTNGRTPFNIVVRDGLTTTDMLMGSECGEDFSFVAPSRGR